jgi:hypothetical protein
MIMESEIGNHTGGDGFAFVVVSASINTPLCERLCFTLPPVKLAAILAMARFDFLRVARCHGSRRKVGREALRFRRNCSCEHSMCRRTLNIRCDMK